jgi:hypothetical protein
VSVLTGGSSSGYSPGSTSSCGVGGFT